MDLLAGPYFRKSGIEKTEGFVFYTRGTAMSKCVLGDKELHKTLLNSFLSVKDRSLKQ